ncbi:MAG: MarR family winged helix-turn-helix transcriptional regulator [Candidatus Margulisiibacteriota bacterium]
MDSPFEYDPKTLKQLMAVNLLFQQLNKVLEGKSGLSLVQWLFMTTLADRPTASPLALAKALKVTPGTLSQTLERLQRRAYIISCNDPQDERRKMLALSKPGKEALEKAEALYNPVFKDVHLMTQEIERLRHYLDDLIGREN